MRIVCKVYGRSILSWHISPRKIFMHHRIIEPPKTVKSSDPSQNECFLWAYSNLSPDNWDRTLILNALDRWISEEGSETLTLDISIPPIWSDCRLSCLWSFEDPSQNTKTEASNRIGLVACTVPHCSCPLTILNSKAEFEPDTQFLNQPWNCFAKWLIFWINIPWIVPEGCSRFRGKADRWENVAFLLPVIEVKS